MLLTTPESYLQKYGESLLVLGRGASAPGILPVHVETIESPIPQECNGVRGEILKDYAVNLEQLCFDSVLKYTSPFSCASNRGMTSDASYFAVVGGRNLVTTPCDVNLSMNVKNLSPSEVDLFAVFLQAATFFALRQQHILHWQIKNKRNATRMRIQCEEKFIVSRMHII